MEFVAQALNISTAELTSTPHQAKPISRKEQEALDVAIKLLRSFREAAN